MFAIQIEIKEPERQPIITYYMNKGVKLHNVKYVRDFCALGAQATTYIDPDNAARKAKAVDTVCKRLMIDVKKRTGIDRQYIVKVVAFQG